MAFHPRVELSHFTQHIRNGMENIPLRQQRGTFPQSPPFYPSAEMKGFLSKATRRKATRGSSMSYSLSNPAWTRARSFLRAIWLCKTKYTYLGHANIYLKRETGIKSPLETQ